MMLYIAALLGLGFAISTLAANQLQAMQMTFFFFLPTMLLSGFMFPFRGMPQWAQALGEIFPATHFLRIVRGILLKGNGAADVAAHVWPIALFLRCRRLRRDVALPADTRLNECAIAIISGFIARPRGSAKRTPTTAMAPHSIQRHRVKR